MAQVHPEVESEKAIKRAERFGLSHPALEEQKRRERAERFGIVPEEVKLDARKERFKPLSGGKTSAAAATVGSAEFEAKKKVSGREFIIVGTQTPQVVERSYGYLWCLTVLNIFHWVLRSSRVLLHFGIISCISPELGPSRALRSAMRCLFASVSLGGTSLYLWLIYAANLIIHIFSACKTLNVAKIGNIFGSGNEY